MAGMQQAQEGDQGTALAKKLKTYLYICMAVHLGLAIWFMISVSSSNGLYQIISVLILFCGLCQYNFCCILFYIFMCLMNAVQTFTLFGFFIQCQINKNGGDGCLNWKVDGLVCVCLFCVYYIAAIVLAFLGYREFKAMQMEGPGAPMGGAYQAMPGNGNQQ